MENPYDKGVVIFEADLLPKDLRNDANALDFIERYGGVTVYSCKYFGWLVGAPPEIDRIHHGVTPLGY